MFRKIGESLALLLLIATYASAVPTITLTDHFISPTPNQEITLTVSGGDLIQGVNLYIEIGDGTIGPVITDVDLVGGFVAGFDTIFTGNSPGTVIDGTLPARKVAVGTTTSSGFIPASGVLGRITVDATGIPGGVYKIRLSNIPFDGEPEPLDSNFGVDLDGNPVPANFEYSVTDDERPYSLLIVPGVPEPGSLALAFIGILGFFAACVRKRIVAT